MRKYLVEQPIKWYKDNKLMIGIVIVITSFVLGFWGKVVIVSRFYKPVELLTGISIYAFSFILLFIGVFMVGWETVKMIQYRIRHHVKKTVRKTYYHAKELPKKGYDHAKRLHKRSMDKIAVTSKTIAERIKQK